MKTCEMYRRLIKVRRSVQTIKDYADDLDAVDKVTAAQYTIQDEMTEMVDDLLMLVSNECKRRCSR
jgi:hypothetical protein